MILEYFSFLFHSQGRLVATLSYHSAAIEDPLMIEFGLVIDPRLKELFQRGLFLQRPSPRAACPRWSLHQVLAWLTALDTDEHLSLLNLLSKAVFCIALSSGLHISQLKALTCFPAWTVFSQSRDSVSLAMLAYSFS